ncbi:MAG TPA: hypothetical protein VHT73_06255, partial [Thermodesulfobacteriota bacterium]|nr:hypothetical protein [Thermodesulfobacteriota bacterium]
ILYNIDIIYIWIYNPIMTPRKPKGDKTMERLINLRMSNELMQALEETKWTLRKSVAEIIRESVIEYMDKHLPKDAKEKVQKLLDKAPEETKPKRGGK